jgi:hypothetical protein
MKELAVKITADAGQSIKETQKLEDNLKEIDKSINDINSTPLEIDKEFQALNDQVDKGGLGFKELSKAMKSYRDIALKAGLESPIGKDAILRAGQLKDDLRGLGEEISRTRDGASKMQAALQLGSTVTAGYQAFQGVTALVGVENEKLMETMVKLQGATAVLTSLEQIRGALEKESFLMLKAKALQTNLLSIATLGYSAVVGTTTGAVKLFRLALVSTGIGAIIVGLGLLIANMDKVAEAFQWVGQKALEVWDYFRGLGTGIKILLSIMFPFVGVIWAVTEALEAMGVVETLEEKKARQVIEAKMKISTEAHKKRVDQIKEQIKFVKTQQEAEKAATDLAISNIDKEIELRQAAGQEIKDLEKAKLQILINSAQQQYRLSKTLLELQDAELLSRRQHNIDIQKDAGKNTAELEKALEFEKRQRALNIEENLATEKKALDDALHNLKVFNITMETERKNAQKKELEDETAHQDELERIQSRKAENIKQANTEVEKSNANLYLMLSKMAKEASDKQKKEDEEELKRKLGNIEQVGDFASQGFETLSNLSTAFSKNSEKAAKRDFQINKLKSVSEAGVDGTKAVLSTFANTPTGLGGKIAAASFAGIFAASNIARILSAQYGGSATGAMSSSVAATNNAVITPQSQQGNDINNTSTNVNSLLNGGQSVLVVDSFTKVAAQQDKVQAVGTIG